MSVSELWPPTKRCRSLFELAKSGPHFVALTGHFRPIIKLVDDGAAGRDDSLRRDGKKSCVSFLGQEQISSQFERSEFHVGAITDAQVRRGAEQCRPTVSRRRFPAVPYP